MSLICIYGLGSGELYEEFQPWLRKNEKHFLVFLEDQEEVYASLFSHPLFQDPQVKTYFITPDHANEIYKQIAWEFVFVPFSYKAHPLYNEKRAAEVFATMAFYQTGIALFASDYSDCGIRVLKNVRQNSPFLPEAYKGSALKGSFRGIPAIICGGGPSLSHNVSHLAKLSDRALIFSGGAALPILAHHHITPHFGAGIDPFPVSIKPFAFERPFFYQGRVAHNLLKHITGPKLWMPDNGSYPLEKWLNESLGLSVATFDAGWSVANFCTTIALDLGCNPIIFVGMDLSAGPERLYAPGIDKKKEEENLILVHDVEGRPFYSRRDWVMSGEWTAELAQSHPEISFINATEGGIGFKGIINRPLKEVIERECQTAYDLENQIKTELAKVGKTALSEQEVTIQWTLIDESIARALAKCRLLFQLMSDSYPLLPTEKGKFILYKLELEEELIYTYFLSPLWNIWQYVFKRELKGVMEEEVGFLMNQLLFFEQTLVMLEREVIG